jgi:hypothetical protein
MCQNGPNVCSGIHLLDLPDGVSQSSLVVYDSIFLLSNVVAWGFLEFEYMLAT